MQFELSSTCNEFNFFDGFILEIGNLRLILITSTIICGDEISKQLGLFVVFY